MARHRETESEHLQDIRAQATKTIWSYATGMVALSLIFAPAVKNGIILPIIVVVGAAGGTAVVWRSPQKPSKSALGKSDSIEKLEQRVANLEAIAGTDGLDFEHRFKQLESPDR